LFATAGECSLRYDRPGARCGREPQTGDSGYAMAGGPRLKILVESHTRARKGTNTSNHLVTSVYLLLNELPIRNQDLFFNLYKVVPVHLSFRNIISDMLSDFVRQKTAN
jgi:hypothetical protein